ncbi:methionine aminopeptidase [Candidatus Photodesmus blepharus]|uniref:Methionine aminopeptidase n=1 Tax=Candidatus Photodesmus blepharonis TaxID=1179155 RepID=A0A084CNX3_9GAMM|nr:type I methionyl aminopeptidase [Candidatus Photodesmus blepharus]KEY91502.1 methionine aminopeptidase [Candidatus Photodesmus blepharus]
MSVKIKTIDEIERMRQAGQIAAKVLEMIGPYIQEGMTTNELNDICHNYILEKGAYSATLNYHGFPKSICTSINHVVCHGIPETKDILGTRGKIKPALLKDGDIINIDVTVVLPDNTDANFSERPEGYHGDTSKMFLVGSVSPANKRLCMVAQEALYVGIRQVKPGAELGNIGTAIERYIKDINKKDPHNRFSLVRDFCGHGIGNKFHEDPQVVHHKNNNHFTLKEGMCFTIEPMINAGKFACTIDTTDGWTVFTEDGKNSAQWEHTILVTSEGYEVLTLRKEEKIDKLIND